MLDDMIALARSTQQRAYAPYSNFNVGACLRADDGSLHIDGIKSRYPGRFSFDGNGQPRLLHSPGAQRL